MSWLRRPLERRLTSLLAAEVSIDGLDVSMLKGTIDIRGLRVNSAAAGAPPLLEVQRIKAELSLAHALRKQIVVRSIVIERPRLALTLDAAGRLNLPRRAGPAAGEDATPRPPVAPPDRHEDADAAGATRDAWRVDLQRLLIVDGAIRFRSEWPGLPGYEVVTERVLAEVTRDGDGGFKLTMIVESPRRVDEPATLDDLNVTVRATGIAELTEFTRAALEGTMSLGSRLQAVVRCDSLSSRRAYGELTGHVDLPWLRAFLPTAAGRAGARALPKIQGAVGLNVAARYAPDEGFTLSRCDITASDVRVPPAWRAARASPSGDGV